MSNLKPVVQALKAGADLSAAQYKFVKFGADEKHVVLCLANERAIGVLQNIPNAAAESVCEVAVFGGGAELKLGATVVAGNILTSQVDGEGQKASAAAQWCAAVADEGGVAGDVIAVKLFPTISAAAEA